MAEDTVLFHHHFDDDDDDGTHVDRVEEIRFAHPVYLTGFQVSTLRGVSPPRLRLFAKDALCLASGRFVPLFDGTLDTRDSKQRCEVPKTVSDHVVLRGHFDSLDFSLLGRIYVTHLEEGKKTESGRGRMQEKQDGRMPFQAVSAEIPFLSGFPAPVCSVIRKIARGVELDENDLQVVIHASDKLCSKLGLSKAHIDDFMHGRHIATRPWVRVLWRIRYLDDADNAKGEVQPLEIVTCTKTVLGWMSSMWSESGSRGKNKNVIDCGMRSLVMSCLLCSCRESVLHFVLNGGLTALAGVFKMRGATALMTRYMVCAVELISLTGGPVGCEALLGLWPTLEKTDDVPQSSDLNILHVPGIVSAKLSKENQKTNRKTTLTPLSLPPGMITSNKNIAKEDRSPENRRSKNSQKEENIGSVSRKDADAKSDDREESGKKKSSGKKKEKKKHKSKRKASRDRSSEHRESRRSRDDKESKKHRYHRHSSSERQKRQSKSKDKSSSNGAGVHRSSKERGKHTEADIITSDSPEKHDMAGHTVKRQKCDHRSEERFTCIDLRNETATVCCTPMYDMLFDSLFQPRPQGIIQSVKRLLDRLNVYKCLFDFQAATHVIVASLNAVNKTKPCLTFSDMSGVFSPIATCLGRILTFVKDSIKKGTDLDTDTVQTEYSKGLLRSNNARDFDASMLEYMSCSEFFGQLKLVIHALTLPIDLGGDERGWNLMREKIFRSAASFLVLLMSRPSGLRLTMHHAKTLGDMSTAELANSREVAGGRAKEGMRFLHQSLQFLDVVLDCSQKMHDAVQSPAKSSVCLSALHRLFQSVNDSRLHGVLLCSLQLHAGLLEKLSAVADAWNCAFIISESDDCEGRGAMPTDGTIPSVARLLLELSKLSFDPLMLHEILEHLESIRRAVELKIELQRKSSTANDDLADLDEFLGRLDACQLFSDSGHDAVLRELSSILPKRLTDGESKKKYSVNEEETTTLFNDRSQMGRAAMYLQIIASMMSCEADLMTVSEIYGSHLICIFERALNVATQAFEIANNDLLSAVMAGDFKNDLHLSVRGSQTLEFLCCVVRCLEAALKRLHSSGITVKATGCLRCLIRAHALICSSPENLTTVLGHSVQTCSILEAKRQIQDVLLLWMNAGWTPFVLDVVFDSTTDLNHFSKPATLFTNSCLLGELFGAEWPPLPSESTKRGYLTMPSDMKTRATLARGVETHATAFRYLVEFGLRSESHIFRSATVRLCARSAGLGGGMGLFLVETIVSEISSLIKESGSPSDYYRLVEVLSSLVPWPALKAAFLDAKLTSSISRLLHRIAPDCQKDPSSLAICSAFLDVFAILLDTDIAMDPFESPEARTHMDCPSPSETSVMVAALFANVHHLSEVQDKVLTLLKTTVSMPDGDTILIRGISRWRSAYMTQETTTPEISTEALMDWVIQKLETDGEGSIGNEAMIRFCKELTLDTVMANDTPPMERLPASSRFKSIVQKTQEVGETEETPTEFRPDASIEVFWKFVHAFPPHQLKKNWIKWQRVRFDAAPSFQYYAGRNVLTASCRPREMFFNPSMYRPSHAPSESGSVGTSAAAKPQSDLPPVVALPRRGQEGRRPKPGASSSRPPSIHVDEYRRTVEEDNASVVTTSGVPTPTKQAVVAKKDGIVISTESADARMILPVAHRSPTHPDRPQRIQMATNQSNEADETKISQGVSIPGIESAGVAFALIPGIGRAQPVASGDKGTTTPSANLTSDSRRDQNLSMSHGLGTSTERNKEADSDNSPTAPQLSQSSAEETMRTEEAAPIHGTSA